MIRQLVRVVGAGRYRRPGRQVAARHRAVPQDPRDVGGRGPLSHRARALAGVHRRPVEPAPDRHAHRRARGLRRPRGARRRPGRPAVPPEGRVVVPGRAALVGQPARGSRAAAAHRRPPVPDDRRRSSPSMHETGTDGRYLVRGDLTFRGVDPHLRGRDGRLARSTTARCGSKASPPSTSATSAWTHRSILMLKVQAGGRRTRRDHRRAGRLTMCLGIPGQVIELLEVPVHPGAHRRERSGSGREHRPAGRRASRAG